MKSVLLVSYHFAPQNAIGAVRPTKLAKYLTRMGYEVTVLCGEPLGMLQDPLLANDLRSLPDVRILRERSLFRMLKTHGRQTKAPSVPKAPENKPNPPSVSTPGRKSPLRNALYLWLSQRADAAFARACKRELCGMGKRFDIVFSSYGPYSAHTVACWAKRRGYARRWIADFRDEVAVPFRWQQGRLRRYLRRVRTDADAITSISAGCLKVMGLEADGTVIYNGFDAEDLDGLAFPPKRGDRMTFVHCGQMYGTQRDLSPFFNALAELVAEGAVDAERIELAYAGRDTGGFSAQAQAAGLGGCLHNYGLLPRDEALKLQKSSHVLLLSAWNLRQRQGNVPGKLLEYLMLSMPVLCCVSGDVPNSEAAGILRHTNAGFCYEQANAEADSAALKEYIRLQYDRFARGEPLYFAPDTDAVAAFASRGMAEAFAKIIETL